MGKNKKSSGKGSKILVLSVMAIIAAGMIVLLGLYVQDLNNAYLDKTNHFIKEELGHISMTIDERTDNITQKLKVISYTCSNAGDRQTIMEYLSDVTRRDDFVMIAFSDLKGKAETSDGEALDFSGCTYFKKAAAGENCVAYEKNTMLDGNEGFVYAVPVVTGEKITGVLVAYNGTDKVKRILNSEMFEQNSYLQIIDSSGNVVIGSKQNSRTGDGGNVFERLRKNGKSCDGFSLRTMEKDLDNGRSRLFYYNSDRGGQNAVAYVPLDVQGWYLFSLTPADVSPDTAAMYVNVTVMISGIIAVIFLLLILFIIWNNRRNKKELETIAFVDPVTGGMSWAKFQKDAKKVIEKTAPGTYVFISLDIYKFKLINDSFGSSEGNKTLKYVHDIIKSRLLDGEYICRVSSDIFNILIKNTNGRRIEDFLSEIAQITNNFNEHSEYKYFLQFSSGIFIIDDPKLEFITIQDRANIARKVAKSRTVHGLSNYEFYMDFERERQSRERDMDNRMETALKNHEFAVYLQPKIDLNTNKVAGAEALVRWIYPKRGVIAPNDFIPFFEKNGFITQIDLFVFEEVCKLLHKWIKEGITPVPISVNLSQIHLKNPNFLQGFQRIYQKYDIPASLLEIEITESIVFGNLEQLMHVIDQIHEIGFRCSLDDFGSGYSSLNILKDVRVDTIKIDKAFLDSKKENRERTEFIIKSVIKLANSLGMLTVTEGVETQEQTDFLKNAHCDLAQGFVFSKPVPVEEFEIFLSRS